MTNLLVLNTACRYFSVFLFFSDTNYYPVLFLAGMIIKFCITLFKNKLFSVILNTKYIFWELYFKMTSEPCAQFSDLSAQIYIFHTMTYAEMIIPCMQILFQVLSVRPQYFLSTT